MATTIDNYKIKVTVEGREGLKNLKKDMEDFGTVGGPLGSTINGIIGKLGPLGLAASAAGVAFAALGGRALSLAGELSDIAGATGIAAGTLMNFRQSVVEAGGKAEDFGQIAAKLNQSVQEAASGNEKLQDAFRNLGVYVTDAGGKVRSTESILQDIVGKFRNGELTASQYAAAIDILGKNINKLELAKLQAIADPIKDEQIRQLDKYNDALDKLAETVNTKLITAFGALAEVLNNGLDKLDKIAEKNKELERQANLRGNTRLPQPGATGPAAGVVNPFGIGAPAGERRMTAQELKAFNEAEQARLMSAYRPRPNDRAPGVGPQGEGGFGATPESVIKAREASEKRIADSRIEQERQSQLTINAERLGAILLFTDQQAAIEQKSESQIREIKINSQAEIAKARLDIFAQEKLSEAEKSKEFAVKEKEIRLREATEIAKARAQLTEQLERERQRIQDIITQSKARVNEEEAVNSVIEKRNQFLFDNATLTDRERDRAQKLFDLEEERLKVLRQIALIKDIPPEERVKREAEINDIYAKRKGLTLEQQAADRALQENFTAGFEKAYREYVENSRNYFDQAGRIFSTVTTSMEDAIVEFGKTGKLSFKDFLNTVIEELMRSQARRLIAQTFGAVGNSSAGGFLGGLGRLLGFANGGIIPTNGPVIVGERGPELLLGASGRQVVPNGQLGGGSVTYNINAVDAMSFKEMVARDPSFIYAVSQQGARSVPGGR